MLIADFQQGDYFCEASFDLDDGVWVFKETDVSYCDWKLQRVFPYWNDFLGFIKGHCPIEFAQAVQNWIKEADGETND